MVLDSRALMRRAVELAAARMRANQGGPFGAVIARDGVVLAEAGNQVTSLNDPTAHAEVQAIREACRKLGRFSLEGCEIYCSCEPCPMCLAAIGFDDAAIYREIAKRPAERTIPVRHAPLDEARRLFEEWRDKPDKIMY